eukprot:CAMPEP_0168565692 /NCGR_PEP_ID=MMETSP0413-20121227/13993_1 /TAXON_ID=136452 /ORGANISM="Filamoeba nolandi, Strain NC-AS-23-1" /LENGTH=141 /DNA_ID=CAMNT_0008597605 /DNA_START=451 /DNA_END=876 /DNA_ORIENTATION=+
MNPNVSSEEIGYERLYQLFQKVVDLGCNPLLLQAEDILIEGNEEEVLEESRLPAILQVFSDYCGLDFQKFSTCWNVREIEQFSSWKEWHRTCLESTGITQISAEELTKKQQENLKYIQANGLRGFLEYHLPFYQKLTAPST